MKDFAMFNDAAFERAHESESHNVNCDDVCMMRDVIEVECNPNSRPRIERVDDPDDARLVGSNEFKECELKAKELDKVPICKPTDATECNKSRRTPLDDLPMIVVSEIQLEQSELEERSRTEALPTSAPKLDPITTNEREPLEGKFVSAPRETLIKMGESKEKRESELEIWELTVMRTER